MFNLFKWTKASEKRIEILNQYEPLQPCFLMELIKHVEADAFLDIGANIGAYSILMSSLKSIKNVYAFEPTPSTFNELNQNLAINGVVDKVVVHQIALSDSVKTVQFGIVSHHSGANSILNTSIHSKDKFQAEVTVSCQPLDSVLQFRDRTVALKIDVEGHEIPVLAGARGFLTGNRGVIQIEDYDSTKSSLAEMLGEYGYLRLCHIGPDHYFSNIELDSAAVVSVFEKATEAFIKNNFEQPARESSRINLPGNVAIEVSGGLLRFARRLKAIVQMKPGRC